MSTRVDGTEPPVILITAKATLAAGTACLMLTVTQESGPAALQPVRAQEQPPRLRQDHRARPRGRPAPGRPDLRGRIPARHHRTRPARRIRPRRAMTRAPNVSSADRTRLICKPGPCARGGCRARRPRPPAAAGLRRDVPDVAAPASARRTSGDPGVPVPHGIAATGTYWPTYAGRAQCVTRILPGGRPPSCGMSGATRRVGGHPDLPAGGYEEDPWPSQSVTRFASQRTATLPCRLRTADHRAIARG